MRNKYLDRSIDELEATARILVDSTMSNLRSLRDCALDREARLDDPLPDLARAVNTAAMTAWAVNLILVQAMELYRQHHTERLSE